MSQIAINGIRYTAEYEADGSARVYTSVDATNKLLATVHLPIDAITTIVEGLNGNRVTVDSDAVRDAIAEATAPLEQRIAEKDTELRQLREATAAMALEPENAPVVPIEAGKKTPTRRKPSKS